MINITYKHCVKKKLFILQWEISFKWDMYHAKLNILQNKIHKNLNNCKVTIHCKLDLAA